MHDLHIHQAVGLQGLCVPVQPKLITIASHSARSTELRVLSNLCTVLDNMGLSVIALDAMAEESGTSPGLLDLLDEGHLPSAMSLPGESWSALPSRLGIVRLLREHNADCLPAARALTHTFEAFDVIVLYADAASLTGLFADEYASPLITVEAGDRSAVSAYQAIKQMLPNSHLQPTMLCLNQCETEEHGFDQPAIRNLQRCVRHFLGRQLNWQAMHPGPSRSSLEGMRALALRLLESATPLYRAPSPARSQ